MSSRRDEIVARLAAAGDADRAEGQQRYMKSAMPFHGVRVPQARSIAIDVVKEQPITDRDEWAREVLGLWREATHREQRYAACGIARHTPYRRWLDGDARPMIEEMIVTGAWWDLVDELAGHHMGIMLRNDPDRIRPEMIAWAVDDDLWRRRTSILCQLRHKADSDLDLLTHAIVASIDSDEFFLRKAIGWALRQYAYIDPDWVVGFVDRHADRLSGLSRREALKNVS
ncbi:MAG: DNA alkylation repair protein [Actinomycetota bacterium]